MSMSRMGKGDRHGEAGEASAGAHIDAVQRPVGLLQLPAQWPEAVEDLVDPEVIAFHKPGQIDAAVPFPQQLLQRQELLLLLWRGGPVQNLPELRSRVGGVRHQLSARLFLD